MLSINFSKTAPTIFLILGKKSLIFGTKRAIENLIRYSESSVLSLLVNTVVGKFSTPSPSKLSLNIGTKKSLNSGISIFSSFGGRISFILHSQLKNHKGSYSSENLNFRYVPFSIQDLQPQGPKIGSGSGLKTQFVSYSISSSCHYVSMIYCIQLEANNGYNSVKTACSKKSGFPEILEKLPKKWRFGIFPKIASKEFLDILHMVRGHYCNFESSSFPFLVLAILVYYSTKLCPKVERKYSLLFLWLD